MLEFKAFVEIPIGSGVKYEVDENTGDLKVDRFLFTAFRYPFNYGYIKGTLGGDGDALDVVILSSESVVPGVVMLCHAIGVLETEDENGIDAKIIAVPMSNIDPINGVYQSLKDVPAALLDQIKHFYANYKTIEPGKWVKVKDFKSAAEAEKEIRAGQKKLVKESS
jgi:inorganic pyrophosphatase